MGSEAQPWATPDTGSPSPTGRAPPPQGAVTGDIRVSKRPPWMWPSRPGQPPRLREQSSGATLPHGQVLRLGTSLRRPRLRAPRPRLASEPEQANGTLSSRPHFLEARAVAGCGSHQLPAMLQEAFRFCLPPRLLQQDFSAWGKIPMGTHPGPKFLVTTWRSQCLGVTFIKSLLSLVKRKRLKVPSHRKCTAERL